MKSIVISVLIILAIVYIPYFSGIAAQHMYFSPDKRKIITWLQGATLLNIVALFICVFYAVTFIFHEIYIGIHWFLTFIITGGLL